MAQSDRPATLNHGFSVCLPWTWQADKYSDLRSHRLHTTFPDMLCVLRMAYESVLTLVIAANAPVTTHSEYILHCVGCRAWGETPCVHYEDVRHASNSMQTWLDTGADWIPRMAFVYLDVTLAGSGVITCCKVQTSMCPTKLVRAS